MKRARAHAAVADVRDADELLFLEPTAEEDAGHDGNHVAEMRNRTDETLVHVAEMDIQIFAARWTISFRHVLRKDIPRPNTLNEDGAEIANQGREEILWLQSISAANCRRLLAQRAKHSADDFRLPVEIHEPFFDETYEL